MLREKEATVNAIGNATQGKERVRITLFFALFITFSISSLNHSIRKSLLLVIILTFLWSNKFTFATDTDSVAEK